MSNQLKLLEVKSRPMVAAAPAGSLRKFVQFSMDKGVAGGVMVAHRQIDLKEQTSLVGGAGQWQPSCAAMRREMTAAGLTDMLEQLERGNMDWMTSLRAGDVTAMEHFYAKACRKKPFALEQMIRWRDEGRLKGSADAKEEFYVSGIGLFRYKVDYCNFAEFFQAATGVNLNVYLAPVNEAYSHWKKKTGTVATLREELKITLADMQEDDVPELSGKAGKRPREVVLYDSDGERSSKRVLRSGSSRKLRSKAGRKGDSVVMVSQEEEKCQTVREDDHQSEGTELTNDESEGVVVLEEIRSTRDGRTLIRIGETYYKVDGYDAKTGTFKSGVQVRGAESRKRK